MLASMHKWYVVQVFSGQEKKVKKTLEENRETKGMLSDIVEILLPMENVAEVKGGKQRVTEKRFWPGYIFINMNLNDESWMYVKNTPGVIEFLGSSKPIPISQQEIDSIISDIEKKQQVVGQKYNIQVGDQVKIVDGVFFNFTGTVQEVFYDKGRLSVLVSIFGRQNRVDDLEFWQVEQLSSDVES